MVRATLQTRTVSTSATNSYASQLTPDGPFKYQNTLINGAK
jgi:hypothetical protein